MVRVQFPHFPRIFSAKAFAAATAFSERIVLWSGLTALFLINTYAILNRTPPHWQALTVVLKTPMSADAHVALASSLWQEGFVSQARRELLFAQLLATNALGTGDSQVLGATTSPLELLTQWESEPIRLALELTFWQSVVATKPDYRDGFLMVAVLAYRLGNTEEAFRTLKEALRIDPNYLPTRELLTSMEQRRER